MSGKDLFKAMSFIDERFVDEAERRRHIHAPWTRIAALAACLCLVMLSLWCVQPLWDAPPGPGPETTEPYYAPEGFTQVVVYVEEMTDDGFTGTVAELVTPDLFKIGMEMNVVLSAETQYEMSDGSYGIITDNEIDFTGCHVLVICTEYDPDTATIVVNFIGQMPSPEPTP